MHIFMYVNCIYMYVASLLHKIEYYKIIKTFCKQDGVDLQDLGDMFYWILSRLLSMKSLHMCAIY